MCAMRCATVITAALAAFASFTGLGLAESRVDRMPQSPPVQEDEMAVCLPDYRELAAKLEATYAEVPVSAGLGQDGNLVSVFASPDTGTWTLVMTSPQGTSCIVAVGEAWQMKADELIGPPA
jgi:hypothetical protein